MKNTMKLLILTFFMACIPADPPISSESSGNETTIVGTIPTSTSTSTLTIDTISTTTSIDATSTDTSSNTSLTIIDTLDTTFNTDTTDTTSVTTDTTDTTSVTTDTTDTTSNTDSSNPICGNSILELEEQCDDGNDIDDDDCSNKCFKPRSVFLTNEYIGPPNFGGVNVADEFCQDEADMFNISGTFKAWISDDNELNDPYYRFDSLDYEGWYKHAPVIMPQRLVAKGWNGLMDPLYNPIILTSAGTYESNRPPLVKVWNATGPDGKRNTLGTTCENWTNTDIDLLSYVGSPLETNSEWYAYGLTSCGSDVGGKLYCFQVD